MACTKQHPSSLAEVNCEETSCIYKIVSKRLGYVHQMFKEAKLDEALSCFSDDFLALYPGFELMKSDKEALRSFLQAVFANTAGPSYEVTLEWAAQLDDSHAFHVASVRYIDKDGNETQKLKGSVLWEKSNGDWFIKCDCCNSTNTAAEKVFEKSK